MGLTNGLATGQISNGLNSGKVGTQMLGGSGKGTGSQQMMFTDRAHTRGMAQSTERNVMTA